jgi:hypothetical protein
MATTITATFDGSVFVPDQPVQFSVGQKVEVRPAAQDAKAKPLQTLGIFLEQIPGDPDSPGDAAAQHDHYLYGTPKRENP